MSHWAVAPLDRQQVTLFAPTLDQMIVADHPVRLFDELLRRVSFTDWQSMYVQGVGQPPIHPRVMAGCILYGLSLGIRSSRRLEDACLNRLDFIWLMEGRKPDHATICKFRTNFGPQLKELFRKVGRVGIEMGLVTLNQVALDGTDIRASNSRFNTAHRPSLEQKLAVLDQQIEAAMSAAQQQDKEEDALYGVESSPAQLPKDLKNLQRRQEKLRQAMIKLEQMEQDRRDRGDTSPKGPAVPLTDGDSRVLPNKTGGYAPNYTVVLASDSGMILDSQVLSGNDQAATVLGAVANVQASLNAKPRQLVADGNFNTGPNLAGLEKQGVEALMPSRQESDGGVAERADPSAPVAAELHDALPMNPQNKVLDKAAFIYVEPADHYVCPMGKPLPYFENKKYDRHGRAGMYRVYQCGGCAGCPLAARCLQGKSPARRICRDEYEKQRQAMAARLKSDGGKEQYKRRAHSAETPNAVIKSWMNVRQFLLRGREKVAMETDWVTTAYNLMKLMKHKAAKALRSAAAAATGTVQATA